MFIPFDGVSVSPSLVVDTSIYASGDVLCVPKRMENCTLNTKGMAVLRSLLIFDKINQKPAMDILIFDEDPGDIGAANAALDLSSAQLQKLVGVISVASADFLTLKAATNAVAQKTPNMTLPARQGSKEFWMAIVSRGTPTYSAADNLVVKAIFERQA